MSDYQRAGIILYILLIMISLVVTTAICVKAKKTYALLYLATCQALIILWLIGTILEELYRFTPAYPLVVEKIILPLYFFGPFWLLFTLEYLGKINPRNRNRSLLLLVPSLAMALFTLINPDSPWIIVEIYQYDYVRQWGAAFILMTAWSYLLVILAAVLIMIRSWKTKTRRQENVLIVIATIVPIIFSLLEDVRLFSPPEVNLIPVTMSLFTAVMTVLVFRNRLLDIKSLATQKVFSNINESIIIFDAQGLLVDANLAAQTFFLPYFNLFECTNATEFGQNIAAYSKGGASFLDLFNGDASDQSSQVHELFLPDSARSTRNVTFTVSSILSWKQRRIGIILEFTDVTDFRQKTLAHERKRVSSDLHDSLGNSLNIISSNLEYSINHIDQNPGIKDCLQKSYDRTNSAFLDLRRIVDELCPIDIENNGLIWALENLMNRLNRRGIDIQLHNYLSDSGFIEDQTIAENIYLICQEAINNAVTHGRAKTIIITMNQDSDHFKLYIIDDGIGCGDIVKSKGLSGIESRVAQLGGVLEYGSQNCEGFQIKATMPLPLIV